MLSVVLAATSGLVWGVGDFAGGKAAQRAAVLPVVWVSKLVSLPLLAIYLATTYVAPVPASLGWGAVAGGFGMLGLLLFYRALSAGAMTVVAPVTAVTSAAIPVAVGLVSGERPPAVRLMGVGCALVAIALVSLSRPASSHRVVVTRGLVGWSVLSGVGFALFFVCTARASDAAAGQAGLWPVVTSQLSGLLIGGALLLLLRPGGWPRRRSLSWAMIAGPMDMTANALYLLASRTGDLSVVAPLASLYPVTTVVLAMVVDRERVRSVQVAGLALAVAALLLVAR